MTPDGEALFLQAAGQLGLDVAGQLPAFATFQRLLVEVGRHTNLTALLDEPDIILKHFVDSLSCTVGGHLTGELTVLDLGTGAGFPGLPLAIQHPGLQLTLLDATRRKIEFVQQVTAALSLPNATALVGRAETLGRDASHRGRYDRVVTRAVSALPVLAELSLPLLREGGALLAQKGPIQPEELEAGQRVAELLGGELQTVERFTLPVLNDPRSLVVIRKVAATPERYPRREGVPAKHPLS
ncbi:16S rRNA (guanine(527)-N(7))-methyltransferase RsmG [Deinococcus sonorensis]|uniref:Ribosomal RNA small subunit methyltransferase G n=2 Tax=Deinococcus sonorensis TaxID=309891 RepID=A0AAU7UDP2_9DEIO